jgi:hypothetical protein
MEESLRLGSWVVERPLEHEMLLFLQNENGTSNTTQLEREEGDQELFCSLKHRVDS